MKWGLPDDEYDDEEYVDAVNTPNWNDPREGNPFPESGRPRVAKEAYQPRGIADGTVPKRQYIETDDEPWHSTCRPAQPLTKTAFEGAIKSSVGFIEAEEKLTIALSAAKNQEAVEKALELAKEEGAREGSPILATAEKLLKGFAKAEKTKAQLSEKLAKLKAEKPEPKPEEKAEEKAEEKTEEDAAMQLMKAAQEGDAAKLDEGDAAEEAEEVDPVAEWEEAVKKLEADIKGADDAALKGRPKAPKKAGAQGSGWDDMKRAAGGTHSTAGFV